PSTKALPLKARCLPVLDCRVGEPDVPTPEHICRAAVKAMQLGHTHYTPASGLPELRQEIAHWYEKTYGLSCTAEQVIVSNGPKHSVHNPLAATGGPRAGGRIPPPSSA